jgi:hypothetical protein
MPCRVPVAQAVLLAGAWSATPEAAATLTNLTLT